MSLQTGEKNSTKVGAKLSKAAVKASLLGFFSSSLADGVVAQLCGRSNWRSIGTPRYNIESVTLHHCAELRMGVTWEVDAQQPGEIDCKLRRLCPQFRERRLRHEDNIHRRARTQCWQCQHGLERMLCKALSLVKDEADALAEVG